MGKRTGFGSGLAAVILLAAMASPARAQSAGNVYDQSTTDGLVVAEVERAAVNTPLGGKTWDLVTTPTGFAGTGALQANPNTGTGVDANIETNSPRLDFRIFFRSTGTHYVWVRGRAPNVTSPVNQPVGNNDSCHSGLDGAVVATADRMSGWGDAWSWRNNTMDGARATIEVATTGVHVVNLWMREDGFIADRILLTTSATLAGMTEGSTATGPAESAQLPLAVPAAPVLSGTPGVQTAELSWGAVANADTYTVLRSFTAGFGFTAIAAGLTGTTYSDPIGGGVTAYYRVVGVDTNFGAGAESNEVSVTALSPSPRLEDGEEGLVDRNCGCGSAAGLPWEALLLAAGLLLPALRRR